MIQFELPTPISVNAAYKNITPTKGVKRRGRALTQEYEDWKREAGWRLLAQRPPRLIGPVEITYEITTASRIDLGNHEKVATDLLVDLKIIEGDNKRIVKAITMRWSEDIAGCRVTIKPWKGQ